MMLAGIFPNEVVLKRMKRASTFYPSSRNLKNFQCVFVMSLPIHTYICLARSKIGIPRGCPKFVTAYNLKTLLSNEREKKEF